MFVGHTWAPHCASRASRQCGAIARVEQTATAIASFAAQFTLQSKLFKKKNSHRLRNRIPLAGHVQLPVVDGLAAPASQLMRKSVAAIVKRSVIGDDKWAHASIPTRMGGLGVRDPTIIAPCARLASLINCAEHATIHSGGNGESGGSVHVAATSRCVIRVAASKELQKQLTQPLHRRARDKLLREGDAVTRMRLTHFQPPRRCGTGKCVGAEEDPGARRRKGWYWEYLCVITRTPAPTAVYQPMPWAFMQ